MAMGRKPAVSLTAEQRKEAASRAVKYRRHWFMSQEQLAIELGTQPSVIGVIERAGPFGSSRLVAACLALDPAIEPKDEHARRHRAMRIRVAADIERKRLELIRLREEAEQDARRYAEKQARRAAAGEEREEDKDIPFT